MALKKFEEYAKEFVSNKERISEAPIFKTIGSSKEKETPTNTVTEKTKVKDLKSTPKNTISKKVNESAFLVGDDFKVKVVIDVPKALVQEYIDKVKEETDKNPLDNFSEAEIAEQIITFIVKKNLVIDNLTPDFTVGSENVGSGEKAKAEVENDAETLSSDLGVDDNSEEDSDGEIEFKDFNDSEESSEILDADEESDGEIEFNDEPEKKDLGEERKVDKTESDTDSNFEEIEFEDSEDETTHKTVGDLKKEQGQKIETQHKDDVEKATEEEEEIEDMYKKIGYKIGYYENLDLNNLRKL